MGRRVSLLYIMNEYPSVSETFVANEAAAVDRLGVDVVGYALKRGSASRSSAQVALVSSPPGRWRLLLTATKCVLPIAATIARARTERLSLRELIRLVYAELHAEFCAGRGEMDVVTHIHAHFLGRTADVASALAARLDCEWSVTAHNNDAYASTEPALLRMRLERVSAVACANRSVQASVETQMASVHASGRVGLVHCGVDTTALRFSPRPSARASQLVTVGRLVPTKGYETVLKSAALLMEGDDSLHWTIVGDGPLRSHILNSAAYRRFFPRIAIAGAQTHDETLSTIAGASAFVLPCEEGHGGESDGIPVALMEAMAIGVPVITTPVGGIPELVEPGETGFLVAPKDAVALATAIGTVLHSTPAEIDAICRSARARVELDYDLLKQSEALLALVTPMCKVRNGTCAETTITSGRHR
jgi:glycosyltransferase involved in cell wall biosynthesis